MEPHEVEVDGDLPRPRQRVPGAPPVAEGSDPVARAVSVDGDVHDLELEATGRRGGAGEERDADDLAAQKAVEGRRGKPRVASRERVADDEAAVAGVEVVGLVAEEEAEVGVGEEEVGDVGEEVEGEARG
jgi:hypothetical protein